MKNEATEKYTYFQFNKKMGLPIFLRFKQSDFDPEITGFFTSMKFEELSSKESEDVEARVKKEANARLLTINEASMVVAKQISSARESDAYGPEGIIPKKGYNVYRYKNYAMLVYSLASKEWHMGCFPDFGNIDREIHYRVIVNRFLSWALMPFGIIGLWGTPVDEGVVVQRYMESKGEAIYIDTKNRKVLSMDGYKKMRYNFSIIKLDHGLKDRTLTLGVEKLLSFLSVNCTFFGPTGHPVAVRQMLQSVSKVSNGQVFPKDNFMPRQEPSIKTA